MDKDKLKRYVLTFIKICLALAILLILANIVISFVTAFIPYIRGDFSRNKRPSPRKMEKEL